MYKINGLIAVSVLGLSACGGGGGGSSAVVNNGVFKDSNVSGLAYESGGQKGITDTLGAFRYEEDKEVKFSIGKVNLGSGKGKSVMTPLDLVTDGQLASATVINKVRFLMMLDKDNMPSNGIEISEKVQNVSETWEAVDFNADDFPFNAELFKISNSASGADGVEHLFPTAEVARAHLRSTLLCANAGAFKGTYSGSESGSVVLVVDPVTGEVNGSSYNPDNQVSVEVKNTEAIDYDAGLTFVSAEDSAKAFAGGLKTTDLIDGTWANIAETTATGAFELKRFGSMSNSTYRYAASFIGDDKGVFTFNVDSGNNLTGVVYSVKTGEVSNLQGSINSENELKAKSAAGDDITGFINPETLAFTSGVWINGQQQSSGSFTGGGCRLN